MKKRVLLRADGNHGIGWGHVSRMLALGEMLNEKFEVVFVSKSEIETSLRVIKIEEETDFLNLIDENSIVVLDGYDFSTNSHKVIKAKGAVLVCIDDHQHQEYYADAIINHAPGIKSESIKAMTKTKYLLGPKYCLLREPFLEAYAKKEAKPIAKALMCFGGSDIHDLSYKYSALLLASKVVESINVVVGKDYKGKCLGVKNSRINISSQLSPSQMRDLMRECDFAVISSSTILFECLSQGLLCISGYYVDNQKQIYEGFLKMNLIIGIGDLLNFSNENFNKVIDQANRDSVSDRINNIFDGRVKDRLVNEFSLL